MDTGQAGGNRGDSLSIIGHNIGPYHILNLIGEGGMGAVYKARDERLDRVVALKTLLVQHAAEPDLVQRMHIEARAASALSHPNICTIFDVGEWDGRPYIVMEYLEGEALRDRIEGQPLPLEDVLRFGIQLAAALDAAHAKRIIHRDVKPANLFVTVAGPMKMMDFGVAKRMRPQTERIRRESPTVTESLDLTNPGTTVGTVSYMSPEQARGEVLDARTDLFSSGSVLYEMATGWKPFDGPTVAVVLDGILNRDPKPPSEVNPLVPPELDRIILKALEKDRALRYQSASDLSADLKRLQRDASSGRITAHSIAAPQPKHGRQWLWGVAATLVVALAGLWLWKREAAPVVQPKLMSMASLRGIKDNPVASADGERIAFSWTGEAGEIGEKEIYVQLVGSGSPLKLTDGPGKAETPVWAPDGRQVAYLRTGGKENGYYAVPALGGLERRLAPAVDPPPRMGGCNFDWSPDGRSLIIADRPAGGGSRTLYLLDLSTGARKGLGIQAPFVANPVFSPDGARIAFTQGPSFLSHDIFVMPSEGGEATQLTADGRWIAGLAWSSDGRSIVFSSRKTGPFSLWSIPSSGGRAQPVALSGTDAYSPHIARKNSRLVYVRNKVNKNLWRVKPGEGGARELIGSTRTSFQPDYSPDGTRIAFASDRTGSYEIWVADSEGHQPMQITSFGGPQTGSPRWSRDGRWIAFDSRPDGHADVYVVNSGGGEPRRLTSEGSEDRTPFWSADGRWIYFVSNRAGGNQLWRVPFEGGTAGQVTKNGAISGAEDEAGKELYYSNLQGLWRNPAAPVSLAPVFPLVGWSLWRGNLYYARPDAKGLVELAKFSPADKRTTVAVRLEHKPSDYDTFAYSPDGQWLLYDRVDQVDNEILIVDNFR